MTNLQIINKRFADGKLPEFIWGRSDYDVSRMYHVNCYGEPDWIGTAEDVDPDDMQYRRVRFGDIRTGTEEEYTQKLDTTYTVLSPYDSADLKQYILADSHTPGVDMYGTPLDEVDLDIWTDCDGSILFVRAVDWE